MTTNNVIKSIYDDFSKVYKNAAPFVDSGELWDFCIDTVKDPIKLSCIVFANDMGIPPVKSLLCFYERQKKPVDTFRFNGQESQFMGCFMGFVFKFILGYKSQKERCTVNELGVKTATRFFDGPVVEFTF